MRGGSHWAAMQKLASALDASSYYDDELGELYHQHDILQARCLELQTSHYVRLAEQREAASTAVPSFAGSGTSAAAPAVASALGSEEVARSTAEAFGAGSNVRQELKELLQSLTKVPLLRVEAPLFARVVEQEINSVAAPRFDLTSSCHRLYAFFKRRRAALNLQCSMLGSRLRRYARTWDVAQRVAPPLHSRLRALECELEAAERRVRRLRPAVEAASDGQLQRPVGKSCTGRQLFRSSRSYEDTTLSCVFRSDVVACLRHVMFQDRATRVLRRFLQQMQHLPISHREDIWKHTLRLEAERRDLPLPLTLAPVSAALRRRLQELAGRLGCLTSLSTDEGHAFARKVVTDFPVIFGGLHRSLCFPPYPTSAAPGEHTGGDQEGVWSTGFDEEAGPPRPFLKCGTWPSLVLLHAKVDLVVLEQRMLMSAEGGRASPPPSPVATPPGSPRTLPPPAVPAEDRALRAALDFVKEGDSDVVMTRLCQLAEEHSRLDAAEVLGSDQEHTQAPEQYLRAYYLLRHLHCVSKRKRLLEVLNIYRSIQQRLARGVLALQLDSAGAEEITGGSVGVPEVPAACEGEELAKPPSESSAGSQGLAPGWEPPSLATGRAFPHPGTLPCDVAEALARLSDEERLVESGGAAAVIDGQGVAIVHEAALRDLAAVEEEILNIGGHVVRITPESVRQHLDRASILSDLLESEVLYHEAKWRLIGPHIEVYELVPDPQVRRDVAQRIIDIMAERPRFDLRSPHCTEAYAAAAGALGERAALLRSVMEHQLLREAVISEELSRQHEVVRRTSLGQGKPARPSSGRGAAASELHEDPQLSLQEGLSDPLEGVPFPQRTGRATVDWGLCLGVGSGRSSDILDFCSSASMAWQVDVLIEKTVTQLSRELAPEAWRRHGLERASAIALSEAWREVLARGGADALETAADRGAGWDGRLGAGGPLDDPARLLLLIEDALKEIAAASKFGQRGEKIEELSAQPFMQTRTSTIASDFLPRTTTEPLDFTFSQSVAQNAVPAFFSAASDSTPPISPLAAAMAQLVSEFEDLPSDDVALRLYCNLLEHVLLRRRLDDMTLEVQVLEDVLTSQAHLLGSSVVSRCDPIPEFNGVNFGAPTPERFRGRVLAGDVDAAFGELDFSTLAGVLVGCQHGQLRELRMALQHELANRWLYAACAIYNSAPLDEGLRARASASQSGTVHSADRFSVGTVAMGTKFVTKLHWMGTATLSPMLSQVPRLSVGTQHPDKVAATPSPASPHGVEKRKSRAEERAESRRLGEACIFPGALKASIWTGVGNALRDRGRAFKRQCMENVEEQMLQRLAIQAYRHRFLGYCTIFIAEHACDLFTRIQAAHAVADLRLLSAVIPPEMSLFQFSSASRTGRMVNDDGSVHNLFHIPQSSEVLRMPATHIDYTRRINTLEIAAPDLIVGGLAGILRAPIPAPLLEVDYVGPAASTLALLDELTPLTSLMLLAGSLGGDRRLVLRLHHAAEGARRDTDAARRAAAAVLDVSMLGAVQLDDMERVRPPTSPEQLTWDALQGIRLDFLRLKTQVASLGPSKADIRAVLSLLRRKRECAELCTGILLEHVARASLANVALDEAAEICRWWQYLSGFAAEGGSTVVLPGLATASSAEFSSSGEACKGAPLTVLLRPGEDGAAGLGAFGELDACEGLGLHLSDARAAMSHMPPTAAALLWLFGGGGAGQAAPGRPAAAAAASPSPASTHRRSFMGSLVSTALPSIRVPWQAPAPALLSAARALCLLPTASRRAADELRVRLEMQIEQFLNAREVDLNTAEGLDEELELCQTLFSAEYFVLVAFCLNHGSALPRSPEEQQRFAAHAAALRAAPIKQRQGMEKAAGTSAGGPSTPSLQATEGQAQPAAQVQDFESIAAEPARNAARMELQDCYELIGRVVLHIAKSVTRYVVESLARRRSSWEGRLADVGGELVLRFAGRMAARGCLVKTLKNNMDEDSAWVFKERDMTEIVEELGINMLRWLCGLSDDQLQRGRGCLAVAADEVRHLQQQLVSARLRRACRQSKISALLSTGVADKAFMRLFEMDRLHRVLNLLVTAAFEMECRLGVEIRQDVLGQLRGMDDDLLKVRSRTEDYKKDMQRTLRDGLKELRLGLLKQLKKLSPRNFMLQQRVKQFQEDPVWQGKVEPPEPGNGEKQPFSARAEVPLISESGLREPRPPVEGLHAQINTLKASSVRLQTFRRVMYQSMQSSLAHEVQRLEAILSSNTALWERVADMRERQRVIEAELSRCQQRGQAASSVIGELRQCLAEHERACERLTIANENLTLAQKTGEAEMHRYHREGAVDVQRMEADLSKLEARLQGLMKAGDVAVEQLIAVREGRDMAERRRMRLQMFRDNKIMQKAVAKTHLIRMELERGHEEDDECILRLVYDEVQELAKEALNLTGENERLREALQQLEAATSSSRSLREDPGARVETFEETLVHSVSLMTSRQPERGPQRQIGQGRGAPALPELRSSSDPPRPGGKGSTVRELIRFTTAPHREDVPTITVQPVGGPRRGSLRDRRGCSRESVAAGNPSPRAPWEAAWSSDSGRPPILPAVAVPGSASSRPPPGATGLTPRAAAATVVAALLGDERASQVVTGRTPAAGSEQQPVVIRTQPSASGTSMNTARQVLSHLSPVSSTGAL